MEAAAYQLPEVIVTETKEGCIIGMNGCEWPLGAEMRVREGWRQPENLAAGVVRERGYILELHLSDGSWLEMGHKSYAAFGQDGVCAIGATLEARRQGRAELVALGRYKLVSLHDSG